MTAFGNPVSAMSLRQTIYAHDALTIDDMDRVFAGLRAAGPDPDADMINLFSESVTDYVVHQNDPPDYIPEDKAQWLMEALQKNGVPSKAEWKMLIDVMQNALGVPPSLSVFALKDIATALISGRPGTLGGEDHPAKTVTTSDVEALRPVLYAAANGSTCHVTREEAEVLFDIAHATAGGNVDPAFDDLFARAVGNYLTAINLHVPSAADELHREKWLNERESMVGFFSRMAAKTNMPILDAMKSPLQLADDDMAKLEASDEQAGAQSENITDSEAAWVLGHLNRGHLTSPENRLLQWLGAETHALPPQLKSQIDTVRSSAAAPKPFGHRHAIG